MDNRKIILKMEDNKDITISINNTKKITIKSDDRKIEAQEIFNLLNCPDKCNFSVKPINEKGADENVIKYFKDLLENIISEISKEKNNIN